MRSYHNILIHCLVNLGDVLLSTSAVALLRNIYPAAKITMMVRPAAAEIVKRNPVIDEVILYDYAAKDKSWKDTLAFAKTLSGKHYDLCISLDRKLRPALLAFLAGIPVRIGPDRIFQDNFSWVTLLYTHTIHIPHDIAGTHQSENYQAVVRGFTGRLGSAKPVIAPVGEEHKRKAQLLLSKLSRHQKHIALCVKGTFPLKNWPPERFGELVDKLAKHVDASFFIVGAPEDKAYAAELISRAKTPVINLCGETNLMDLLAVFYRTDLFITVDTGAMHIAATTDIPIVAIFGCTSPLRWSPLSKRAKVLSRKLPCCPCSIPADACQEHACMTDISVDEVFSVIVSTGIV